MSGDTTQHQNGHYFDSVKPDFLRKKMNVVKQEILEALVNKWLLCDHSSKADQVGGARGAIGDRSVQRSREK
jgi:hypothetical protein